LRENCGIFGIYGIEEAATLTYLGLYALQHRGQESAGIVSADGKKIHSVLKMGLVADVFNEKNLKKLTGPMAIGHTRYSTTGASSQANIQPIYAYYKDGFLAVAHNGNIVNAISLRKELENNGAIFSSTSDSEVIIHLISHSKKKNLEEKVVEALSRLEGSYSLLIMSEEILIATRDRHGFRPLSLGRLQNGYAVASETCAFDLIEGEYLRSIEPGEIILINNKGINSLKPFKPTRLASCIFEFIYFARPDSYVFGRSVHQIRKNLGKELALTYPIKADFVIPVPDSSNCAAIGYAEESKIPFELGIIRNHYIGRTFIEPSQNIRDFGVKIKHNPVKELLAGKKIVLVDDSIVRGTTTKKIVRILRKAGVKEIHVRITAPIITHPCFYGIDTPTREELIGSKYSVEKIRQHLGVETIGYQTIEGLLRSVKGKKEEYCLACFTGDYPAK
jgi:amidophosphoribosyltransferase